VSWGVDVGGRRELWTNVAAPVMTRLRQPQRQVLDTLVASGVARSRSEALAWCVRLVGQHEEDWLTELRDAMGQVADVRSKGPAA
jgi:Arc/MetJ-type ribon-helix-helix transcriptional regulator